MHPFPTSSAALPWGDDDVLGGTLTWTGVAGFVLDVGGVRVAFDPYVTRPGLAATLFRRPAPDVGAVTRAFPDLDAVFVNHAHFDHAMDLPAVAAVSPGATIHGSATLVELCRRLGVPASALHTVVDGERIAVGPVTVEAVASAHGLVPVAHRFDRAELGKRGVPRTPFRYPCGDVFAYRIEVGGRSIHLHGSAGFDDAALARQRPVDVVIACLAARQGTPRYVERLLDRFRPKVLAPCHHDNFFVPLSEPPRPVPRLDWPGFLADAARPGVAVFTFPLGVPVAI